MVAGAKYRGEFEERLKKAIDEVQKHDDMIIFIDELHYFDWCRCFRRLHGCS